MKTLIKYVIYFFFAAVFYIPTNGQVVTKDEATVIAKNWINIIIDTYGSWGGNEKANIMPLKTLEKDGQKLGYYCHVLPKGFILVSIRKELAPVKFYSELNGYTKDSTDCLPEYIYDFTSAIINKIEDKLAPIESVPSEELKGILEIDYSDSWNQIYNYIPGTYIKKTTNPSSKSAYQEGEFLLTSNWTQDDPYNLMCPDLNCPFPSAIGNALVGCVATAGSQIMHYWSWPPYGIGAPYNDYYDWRNMKDSVAYYNYPTPIEIAAVAELCAEVGEAVDMEYGCDESGAYNYCSEGNSNCDSGKDMESALKNIFRYHSSLSVAHRDDCNSNEWYEGIKSQINLSRPITYSIRTETSGHAVVVDGWREHGPSNIKQYHINFGWANRTGSEPCWNYYTISNAWYSMDELPCYDDELMILNIVPEQYLGNNIAGYYPRESFLYRYFDQDAVGGSAVFEEGQSLQFRPGVNLKCESGYGINFFGRPNALTFLFSRGDLSRGIKINNGVLFLQTNGVITIY